MVDSKPSKSILPVINASPLILLTKAGLLELLQLLNTEILVPITVVTEIQQYGEMDVTAQALAKISWLVVVETPPVPEVILASDLDSGESAVLTWAYFHPRTEVIVDDLAARRCAASLGIPVRGTLGIVLNAKQRGAISSARPVLEQLRFCGMYLSNRVMNQALALVGE